MEAFQLLSRGGAKFDKRRFSKDVQLFNPTTSKTPSTSSTGAPKALRALQTGELPAELDLFKYAARGSLGGAPAKGKAKAMDDIVDGSGEADKDLVLVTGKKREHEQPNAIGSHKAFLTLPRVC